jgi:arsenite oxidase large subunit
MAYKRNIDRLPIIPAGRQGTQRHLPLLHRRLRLQSLHLAAEEARHDADSNWFGVDLSKQQGAETEAWYAPSMYNVVKQDGRDVHLVIKPDVNCVVNSGLGSIRGARMAENRRSDVNGTQQQRLTDPMVWRYGTWQPTSWDDALDLVARVTARVIDKDNENDLSSRCSTTAAARAATRTPGGPASSTSSR